MAYLKDMVIVCDYTIAVPLTQHLEGWFRTESVMVVGIKCHPQREKQWEGNEEQPDIKAPYTLRRWCSAAILASNKSLHVILMNGARKEGKK